MYAAPAAPPTPKKGLPTWVIVLITALVVVFLGVPILAVIAISGVRKYIAGAKTAEARNTLAQIGTDAAASYARDHTLCTSASHSVPQSASYIRGAKYQSTPAEWTADSARNAGFACLQFSMSAPQYYQYSYTASPAGTFEAVAHGDLNGDGHLSTFTLRGAVKNGQLVMAPTLEETDPEE